MENIASVITVPSHYLTARDYKTLCLDTLGGLLEFYDFIIFVFFANTIGELFFPLEIPDWVRHFRLSAYSLPVISPDRLEAY